MRGQELAEPAYLRTRGLPRMLPLQSFLRYLQSLHSWTLFFGYLELKAKKQPKMVKSAKNSAKLHCIGTEMIEISNLKIMFLSTSNLRKMLNLRKWSKLRKMSNLNYILHLKTWVQLFIHRQVLAGNAICISVVVTSNNLQSSGHPCHVISHLSQLSKLPLSN